VDALTGLLDGPRARGAFLLRSVMEPPWSLRVQDQAPLTLVVLVRGRAVLVADDGTVEWLSPGEVAVVRGPEPYTVADDPATAPQVVIDPGQRCRTVRGEPLEQAMDLGVRTWGNSPHGTTVLLTGTYQLTSEVGRRLLGALPTRIVVPSDGRLAALVTLIGDEVGRTEPGQEVVLDRLLDLLLVLVLRRWFSRPEAAAPAWYRAYSDPVVGRALRMLHNHPARPWTVASLAAAVGVSRAGLARRFTALVGEPPMTYLANWRLTLAADLLREPDTTVAAVARQVGYGSPFALSTAFKRRFGVAPRQHRARAAQPADGGAEPGPL
jgi:AraC-type DNA-binding domain-containing proteins